MKTIKKMMAMMMAVMCLSLVMTSCDDDDPEPEPAAAEEIAGSYTNDMTCSVMGQESIFENVTYVVTKKTDTTVDIVLPAFGEAPMALPSITVTGLTVTGADGTYAIADTEFSGTVGTGDSARNYSGTISATFINNTLTVNFSLQYGAMPMAMICSFTCAKPAA